MSELVFVEEPVLGLLRQAGVDCTPLIRNGKRSAAVPEWAAALGTTCMLAATMVATEHDLQARERADWQSDLPFGSFHNG